MIVHGRCNGDYGLTRINASCHTGGEDGREMILDLIPNGLARIKIGFATRGDL